nr:MAG: hypothetical protein DIU78_09725 [Pseudomonadota bacterium]
MRVSCSLRRRGACWRRGSACSASPRRPACEPVRDSRLVLAAATRRVLATGLGVLGIAAPARM